MHYQFETIHPFLDGNGRIGRAADRLHARRGRRSQCPDPADLGLLREES
jgi:fido (protein-threonine AMPylation protein)